MFLKKKYQAQTLLSAFERFPQGETKTFTSSSSLTSHQLSPRTPQKESSTLPLSAAKPLSLSLICLLDSRTHCGSQEDGKLTGQAWILNPWRVVSLVLITQTDSDGEVVAHEEITAHWQRKGGRAPQTL